MFKNAELHKKMLLAFEYGVVLHDVARERGVELTPEMIERAEKMIEGEFFSQKSSHLAGNMVPNLLTVFELDIRE